MKKIKVNKKTANFLKYVEAFLTMLMVMFGMMGCMSFTPFTPLGWCLEITMIIMVLVLGEIEEKPDINNAEHVSLYAPNVSEQHVVQQSHERNEEDESPLLFIIICILMLLAILSVSNFIENYYLY